ncbi:MAG: inositol monophosphatase [Acidimicrobiia bacterium]|nr:inositol monophosphatase [Acidimicrobiia bacterium]
MTGDALIEVLRDAAFAVRTALDDLDDWGLAGTRPGQYRSDLAADAAAVGVLDKAGLGILSEETGLHHPDREVVVALDPVDGSTNASRRLPWYASSLCAVDGEGPCAAFVVNQATGETFEAVRGCGARVDGSVVLRSSACSTLPTAVVGLSGWPPRHGGWKQMRALGAAALDLCAVAAGRLDAYIDFSQNAHGPWDYLAGTLICEEAGASVADAFGRDLVRLEHECRRTPLAAATPALLDQLVALRSSER